MGEDLRDVSEVGASLMGAVAHVDADEGKPVEVAAPPEGGTAPVVTPPRELFHASYVTVLYRDAR